MRIALFTNLDLHSNLAINFLIPELVNHEVKLFLSEKVGSAVPVIPPLQFLDYLERKFLINHLFPHLERNPKSEFLTFRQIDAKYNTGSTFIKDINDPDFLEKLFVFAPDLFLVIRFGRIFKGKILAIPKKGIINLHSAILPDFKGVMGTFRALLSGASHVGATLHYIQDDNIDTGDVIDVIKMKKNTEKSVLWHIAHLYPIACEKLREVVSEISHQDKIQSSQQAIGGSYFSFPRQSEFDALRHQSIKLFSQIEYADMLGEFYQVEKNWVLETIRKDNEASQLPEEF